MDNKKASVMLVKFLISTLLAVLVFWFLTSWACSRIPFIHDKAESTINHVRERIETVQNMGMRRYALQIPDKKAFYFFENSSNQIKMYTDNKLFYIYRNTAYCHQSDPCFCYCDSFFQQTYDEDCSLQLNCQRNKIVCESFDMNFSFQQLGNKFFDDDRDSQKIFFEGGFLLSSGFQELAFHVQRTDFVFNKPIDSNAIHLCARTGECLTEDFSDEENSFNSICP